MFLGVWSLGIFPRFWDLGFGFKALGPLLRRAAALQNLEGRSGCWSWDFGRIKASAFRVSNSGQGLLSILFQPMFILLTFTNGFRYPDLLCTACAGSGLK